MGRDPGWGRSAASAAPLMRAVCARAGGPSAAHKADRFRLNESTGGDRDAGVCSAPEPRARFPRPRRRVPRCAQLHFFLKHTGTATGRRPKRGVGPGKLHSKHARTHANKRKARPRSGSRMRHDRRFFIVHAAEPQAEKGLYRECGQQQQQQQQQHAGALMRIQRARRAARRTGRGSSSQTPCAPAAAPAHGRAHTCRAVSSQPAPTRARG